MKQEDKELLIKDLCARLSYGVKIQCGDYLFTFDKEHMGIGLLYTDFNRNPLESPKIILSGCYYGEDIKPYLFPLSSMTEEQREEISKRYNYHNPYELCVEITNHCEGYWDTDNSCNLQDYLWLKDWFDKNHFDYHGLIEKGLAIDATGLNIY